MTLRGALKRAGQVWFNHVKIKKLMSHVRKKEKKRRKTRWNYLKWWRSTSCFGLALIHRLASTESGKIGFFDYKVIR